MLLTDEVSLLTDEVSLLTDEVSLPYMPDKVLLSKRVPTYRPPAVSGRKQPHSGDPLGFHADQGATDIISLLCLSAAQEGGASKWVSSIAIHNELLRRGRKVGGCTWQWAGVW